MVDAAGGRGIAVRVDHTVDAGRRATPANWRHTAEHHAKAKQFGFISSETPCFVGRAVAALAADPHRAGKSGGVFTSLACPRSTGSPTSTAPGRTCMAV